jgi:hypothetical protein
MTNLHRCLLAASLAMTPAFSPPFIAQTNFRPLEFLVGHCWIGTFPNGKETDEHCFEWVFDHKFIRDRHVVRGGDPYEGESLYRWDETAKRIGYNYWNSAGQMMTGSVEETPEGVVFPQRLETASGTTEMKAIWTRPSPDSYHVWVGQKTGAEWKVLWTMDLKRKS